jgi:medium-chain acyl-[acyl-carrier-protein] hydrolase
MTTSNMWIRCFKPNPQAHFRLFCIPYAGGSASVFRTWAAQLPSKVEVCSIQLPGREDRLREPPFADLTALIAALLPAFVPYLNLPFAFFGHSLGALICFELVRQFRQQGYSIPSHLFVSGRHAPQIPNPNGFIHNLPHDQLIEELRHYAGTPEVVLQNAELMALFLPILRADLAMNETYTYVSEPPFNCPISAYGGLADQKVSAANLEAWQNQTAAAFNLQLFPGGHFFWKTESEDLLQSISQQLLKLI